MPQDDQEGSTSALPKAERHKKNSGSASLTQGESPELPFLLRFTA